MTFLRLFHYWTCFVFYEISKSGSRCISYFSFFSKWRQTSNLPFSPQLSSMNAFRVYNWISFLYIIFLLSLNSSTRRAIVTSSAFCPLDLPSEFAYVYVACDTQCTRFRVAVSASLLSFLCLFELYIALLAISRMGESFFQSCFTAI